MDKVIIFCDGGCRGNGKENNIGGWGAVLTYGETKKEIYGSARNTTNNRMELTGVIEALTQMTIFDIPVEVNCDSAYLVNCMRYKWYIGWKRNGWRNSKKQPVENRELWEGLLRLVEKFKDIEFVKVKGHVGVEGNEIADMLVNKAMNELEDEV
jgi:ribonuclease HI